MSSRGQCSATPHQSFSTLATGSTMNVIHFLHKTDYLIDFILSFSTFDSILIKRLETLCWINLVAVNVVLTEVFKKPVIRPVIFGGPGIPPWYRTCTGCQRSAPPGCAGGVPPACWSPACRTWWSSGTPSSWSAGPPGCRSSRWISCRFPVDTNGAVTNRTDRREHSPAQSSITSILAWM